MHKANNIPDCSKNQVETFILATLIIGINLLLCTLNISSIAGESDSLDILLEKVINRPDPQSLIKTGDIYIKENNYAKADYYYSKAENLTRENGDSLLLTDILINRSYIYETWSVNDIALKMLEEALKISNAIDSPKGIAKVSLATGNIYANSGKNGKALYYYLKTLENAEKVNNATGTGVALSNIGMVYSSLGNNKRAIDYLLKAEKLLKKNNILQPLANTYNNLSVAYADSGLFDYAKKYLLKGLKLSRKYGTVEDIAISYHIHAIVFNRKGNYHTSNIYLDTSLQLANSIGFKNMIKECYNLYSENYSAMNNPGKAFDYLKKYEKIKDTLFNEKMQNSLSAFEVKYKLLEKEKEIELLQKDKRLKELEIQKRKTRLNTILALLSSVLLILLLLLFLLIQKRKKEKEIHLQKIEISKRKKQIAEIELEKNRVIRLELEDKLELQSRQLTTHALNMLKKNKLLISLQEHINSIKLKAPGELKPELTKLEHKIKRDLKNEKEWELFRLYFEQVNKGFFSGLKSINNELTPGDLRLAALTKLNLSIKEAASVLNLSPETVKSGRYRLRKKLGLDASDNLYDFLDKL